MHLSHVTLLFCTLALAAAGCGGAGSRPGLVVGAVEDAAKNGDPDAKMALAHGAGYRAIVLSSVWTPPLVAPSTAELAALQTAAASASAAGIRPIVAVYSFSSVTPTSAEARGQFAAYAAACRGLPAVHDVIVGNEPNLNLFWMPQFAADGSNAAAVSYLALLAETYDALKAVSAGPERHRRVALGAGRRRSRGLAADAFADHASSATSAPPTAPRDAPTR